MDLLDLETQDLESLASDGQLPDISWANDLPPLEENNIEEEQPKDQTGWVNAPDNMCPSCGEEIVREPGKRGKLPKKHPECREADLLEERAAKAASGLPRSSGPRPVRVTSKERQAAEQVEEALETARRGLLKAVGLLMLVDPFDALVLHINSPDIIRNCRPILMRFPWLREQATNASTGASIFGLIVAIGTTLLPIAAHHKLIPGKLVSEFLTKLPMVMLNIQKSMEANSGIDMTEVLMARVQQQAAQEQAAKRYQQAQEPVDASVR